MLLEKGQQTPSPYIEKMISDFRARGITDEIVLDVFRRVDRKLFLVSSMNVHLVREGQRVLDAQGGIYPYKDSPQQIGWNTSISAPGMHAETLKALKDGLVKAKNILDIGTGSGFISAAMAAMAPADSNVYAVDHIGEINLFAKHNIEVACPYLVKRGSFIFVTKDGRKGLPEFEGKKMQYDVIHVGG